MLARNLAVFDEALGVATGKRAAHLAAEGASHVIADFRDLEALLKALENAAPVVRG